MSKIFTTNSVSGTSDSSESRLASLLGHLLAPVDIASLVFYRVGFGAMMAWWAWDYLASGRVHYYYVQPRFHFTYYLFDWVRPWPGVGMYLHFVALAVLGLCIAAGCCFRVACVLFAVGFTYVFLLDATNYQNHYYLIILLTCALAIMPANRAVSVDAANLWCSRLGCTLQARTPAPQDTAPAWTGWLLRFHIALP